MFKPLYLGTNHMLGQDSFVPLMVNNFEIRVYNMDGSLPGEFSTLLTMTTDEVGDIEEEQDSITVHYGNGVIKFPTKVDYADVDWTLNCYCDPNVYEGLVQWRRLCYNPETEEMGVPSEYAKLVYFIRYDGKGNPKHVFKCPHTWIKGLRSSGGNQEGGEIVKCNTTLVISKVIPMKPEDFKI